MNTFWTWLQRQEYRQDTIGTLSKSLLNVDKENRLPEKRTKTALIAFLVSRGVDSKWIEVLKDAWKEYKEYRKHLDLGTPSENSIKLYAIQPSDMSTRYIDLYETEEEMRENSKEDDNKFVADFYLPSIGKDKKKWYVTGMKAKYFNRKDL